MTELTRAELGKDWASGLPRLKDGHGRGNGVAATTTESGLHELVCEGRVPLAAAQEAIATDWTTALDNVR
jgi:hypothetical protein